jgi:hypothetical protein
LIFCTRRVEFYLSAGSSYINQLIAKTQNITEFADELTPCFDDPSSPDCPVTYFVNSANAALFQGLKFAGYGSICECEGCSLVIMLVSFVVAGVLCVRRFYSGTTNRSTEAGRRVIKVRRQITVTVSTVFLTFLIRAVYAAVLAASRQSSNLYLTKFAAGGQRDFKSTCNRPNVIVVCDPCQGLGVLVQIWLWLSSAFPFTVFLLSSPVTILVVLWSMTTDTPLPSLVWKWSGFRKKAALGDSMKSFIKAGGES